MDKKFPDGIAEARDGMNNWAGTTDPEKEAGWIDYAMAWAAIAQAEQLKRMADAAERRNVLLEECNAQVKVSAEEHTARTEVSINNFLNTVFGEDTTE